MSFSPLHGFLIKAVSSVIDNPNIFLKQVFNSNGNQNTGLLQTVKMWILSLEILRYHGLRYNMCVIKHQNLKIVI